MWENKILRYFHFLLLRKKASFRFLSFKNRLQRHACPNPTKVPKTQQISHFIDSHLAFSTLNSNISFSIHSNLVFLTIDWFNFGIFDPRLIFKISQELRILGVFNTQYNHNFDIVHTQFWFSFGIFNTRLISFKQFLLLLIIFWLFYTWPIESILSFTLNLFTFGNIEMQMIQC